MNLLDIVYEDFVNYKVPSLFLATCLCDFKCCKEANLLPTVCQNYSLKNGETRLFDNYELIRSYKTNPITKAIVFGGLEPMLQYEEVFRFVEMFRFSQLDDDIVIYTGYDKDEILSQVQLFKIHKNIVFKFGRWIPNCEPHFDETLGVNLASPNQYGERIS